MTHHEPMRYGVQYQHDSGFIAAGPVRMHDGREHFIFNTDTTGYAIGAVAQFLVAQSKHRPFQITDKAGNTYELTARLVES